MDTDGTLQLGIDDDAVGEQAILERMLARESRIGGAMQTLSQTRTERYARK